jgi:hypothetical protein
MLRLILMLDLPRLGCRKLLAFPDFGRGSASHTKRKEEVA